MVDELEPGVKLDELLGASETDTETEVELDGTIEIELDAGGKLINEVAARD